MDILHYKNKLATFKNKTLRLYRSLSPERVFVFWLSFFLSIVFIFSAITIYNKRFLTMVPAYGGVIREGIIGTPRFINPVFAVSDQDKDLTTLVYSGLTKKDSEGNIVLDVAESLTESDDNLHYTVTLKSDAEFHDGTPLTADDVIYTIDLVQNPLIKSPHRIEWEGVTIEKISDTKLIFSLKKPFPRFLDILVLGILPKHIWKNLTEEQLSLSDYNIHAIGSGPYSIEDVSTNSGIPDTFTLSSHSKYTLGRPYIDTVIISTYQNEKYLLKAFEDGKIDRIHGISTDKISQLSLNNESIHTSLLPRTFAVFFNPNKLTPLSDKNVRAALQMAINKQAIVDMALHSYGKVINGPYPFDEELGSSTYNVEKAREILLASKVLKNSSSTLDITLATANTAEMKQVAEMIQADWEKIGVKATLSIYEVSDLNQSVIKERDFQALLFGTITQNPSDLYAFWHSSQRNYPGLNISNYVSKKLDTNLEILRTESNAATRDNAYQAVKKEFSDEIPGIFLYSPALVYIANDEVTSPLPRYSSDNSSRFGLIESWHRYTDYVWIKTYYKPLLVFLENTLH